jgi:hypothetical protein
MYGKLCVVQNGLARSNIAKDAAHTLLNEQMLLDQFIAILQKNGLPRIQMMMARKDRPSRILRLPPRSTHSLARGAYLDAAYLQPLANSL